MEAIFVLLPLALLIAAIAVGFFVWAARTGQFDDLETPAVRILFDDEEPRRPAQTIASAIPAVGPGEAPITSQPLQASLSSSRRVPE